MPNKLKGNRRTICFEASLSTAYHTHTHTNIPIRKKLGEIFRFIDLEFMSEARQIGKTKWIFFSLAKYWFCTKVERVFVSVCVCAIYFEFLLVVSWGRHFIENESFSVHSNLCNTQRGPWYMVRLDRIYHRQKATTMFDAISFPTRWWFNRISINVRWTCAFPLTGFE